MIVSLIQKIVSLFLMMGAGVALVRCKLLSTKDSRVLSVLCVYLFIPCVILTSFQVDYTQEVRDGLLLAFGAAILIHLFLLVGMAVLKRVFSLDRVEVASVMYSNAANLVIPIVSAVLGSEWVIYSSAFVVVQLCFLWSHGKATICGEQGFSWKKVLSNINILAILAGILLFVTGFRFPGAAGDAISSLGGMLGPGAMLVTGILLAEVNLGELLKNRRLWLVTALRLLAVPLLSLAFLKYSPLKSLVPGGEKILLITLLATITPSASSVTQMAQVYGGDADYAGAINALSTLCSLATMPCLVALYLA